MILRFVAAALCAAALASSAAAQDTPVRSGEHASFTRLVFPARGGLDWALSRPSPDQVTLVFDDPDLRLDTGAVFARIPRTRLESLVTDGPAMTLDLACACDVAVSQIPSGHIVIDIAAAPRDADAAPPPIAPGLPIRLPPVAALSAGLSISAPAPLPTVEAAPGSPARRPEIASGRAAQISIRQVARQPLLPGSTPPTPETITRLACREEAVAADLFRRDPAVALAEIPVLRGALVDGADRPVPEAHRALAEAYLAAGLGAEALDILDATPEAQDELLTTIAAALDGMPDFASPPAPFEASCGPATTILALLTGITPKAWSSVDAGGVAEFLDTLPRAARADLVPRLRPALARLGEPDLLTLDPVPREVPPPPLPVSAGTDSAAVSATIASLDTEGAAPAKTLANGLALRSSTPEGPLRDELERSLAIDLVLSGHLTEAAQVLGGRPALAEAVLAEALDTLPPEDAVVAAIRLRPALDGGGSGARRAVEALQVFGLDSLAGGFGARPNGPAVSSSAPDPEVDAWRRRYFGSLDPETPRGRIAALRQERNANPPPADDFARAASAAEDSARLSDLVLSLIDPPG